MLYSRIIHGRATSAAPPFTLFSGTLKCFSFTARPMLFEKAESASPTELALDHITADEITAFNDTTSGVEIDDVVKLGQNVQGRWMLITNKTPARVKFITTGKMTSGAVAAAVLNVLGETTVAVGDAISVGDQHNIYPEVEEEAIGWAWWQPAITDSPAQDARWEIEKCTMPISEAIGIIGACTCGGTTSTSYTITVTDPSSHHPDVDVPPEWTWNGSAYTVTVKNPFLFRMPATAVCVIKRVNNEKVSKPTLHAVPHTGSATTASWEIWQTRDALARWAKFEKSYAGWDYVSSWEGVAPTFCGTPAAICGLGDCSCFDSGDVAIGFFDPSACNYVLIASESAMAGVLVEQTFLTNAQLYADALVFETKTAKVACVDYGAEISIPLTDCDPPPDPPCECTYTYSGIYPDGSWGITSACPEGCGTCLGPPWLTGSVMAGDTRRIPCSGA